ncbi:hypothetical protein K439DRAFT_1659988 [Ramaria rubella]|nr:hypothetical protein K439DRAFT_1659988 [Ramaria rubella]
MSPDPSTRRRTTRACDQCRKTKSRCEHPQQSQEPCRNCLLAGSDCTFLEPSHKRGPPKGYLSALEQRLHDAEALLGVIISSSDPRATTMIADLSKDSLAASIISRVANGSFGPIGRDALRRHNADAHANSRRRSVHLRQQQMDHAPPLIDVNGHLVFNTPSNTWQDYLNLRLTLESGFRAQASSKTLPQNSSSSTSPQHSSLPNAPIPKHPEPPPFRFQNSALLDSSQMHIDSSVLDSPSSTSSGPLPMHDTPDDESEDSISSHRSPSTGPPELRDTNHEKEPSQMPYNHLTCSLGLDSAFSALLCSGTQFTAPQIGDSDNSMNASSRPRMGKWAKTEDTDNDSWARLVLEGSDPPNPLFDGDPNLDMLELAERVRFGAELSFNECLTAVCGSIQARIPLSPCFRLVPPILSVLW